MRTGALFATSRRRVHVVTIDAQLAVAGLPVPMTEFRFHPTRKWRFDYAWPLFKVALEIEGGAHGRLIIIGSGIERRGGKDLGITSGTRIRVGGRHQSGPGFEADITKYNAAAVAGWAVLRGTTRQVRDGETLADVRAALVARGLE